MTGLYYLRISPALTTQGHPEKPERASRCWQRLERSGLVDRCKRRDAKPMSQDEVRKVHSRAMVALAKSASEMGGGRLEADTPISPKSFDVALLAAGTAATAVDDVLAGVVSNAFCLVRPPGHHATPTQSMGFCIINNIALAARRALDQHQLQRILIVDWDVHHGNGTQDIFYGDGRVMFVSLHRHPFYPGTAWVNQTGTERG